MVRVLAIADEVCEPLWGPRAAALAPDLVVAAGDLPWDYLEFMASSLDVPVVFVPGNHDPQVESGRAHRSGLFLRAGLPVDPPRPQGCTNVDGAVARRRGAARRRARRVRALPAGPEPVQPARVRAAGGPARPRRRAAGRRRPGRVDLLLTHAPPRGPR